MRVLMATTRCFPEIGGIESHVAEVSRRLEARGHPVELVTTDRSGELARAESVDGVDVRRYRAWPRARDYYLSPGLFWAVLRNRADVVHVQGIHTLVPPLAMLAALLRRTPYVVTFHTGGNSSALRTRMRGVQFGVLAPLLRRASALIAVSEFEARRFEKVLGWAEGAIPVVRNGGTLPAPEPPVATEPGLIVSPGRLERYKGHHRIIEALPKIIAQRPDARLEILGAGPYEAALRSLAERLGLADRVSVRFIPPPQRSEMAAAVGRAETAVLLSDYEAHPVAVMEALSVATPVVVACTSGLTELVECGWATGVPPDADADQVAEAVLQQMTSPVRPDIEQLPTWESSVDGLESVYRTVRQETA